MHARRWVTVALAGLLLAPALAWSPLADAGLFWGKKDPKDGQPAGEKAYPPPDKDAMATECEPYRLKAVEMSKQPFLLRQVSRPRTAWLKHRYYRCTARFREQERLYLNHVDIDVNPDLVRSTPALPPIDYAPVTVPADPLPGDIPPAAVR